MFRDLAVGLAAILGAALFSQLPEFFQQYLQRLGGHLDEARRLQESTPALAGRVTELAAAHDSLVAATVWSRPYAFASHLQPDIAANTLGIFHPALPLPFEGLAYAAIGMVVGVGILRIVTWPFRRRAANAWN